MSGRSLFTNGVIKSMPSNTAYRDNYDRIFKKKTEGDTDNGTDDVSTKSGKEDNKKGSKETNDSNS